MGKWILYAVLLILGILVVLFLIAVIRTLFLPHKTTDYQFSTETERTDAYASKLSRMIQYETVSHRDQPEIEKFLGYHKLLEELFPHVFATCDKIEIDGNLMLRWKGKDPSMEPIGLMSHQDVVEATGDWKYPPYSGTIADGMVWGRGSADTKCSVASFYQAVEELIQTGYTPACDVYLISSCTEEIMGDGGPKLAGYMKDHGIHLYLLNDEGGSLVMEPMSGIPGYFAAIGIFEKGYGDVKFTAKGHGGHSSYPGKNTPIPMLSKFVCQVEKKSPFRSAMSPAVVGMLENLAPYSTSFLLRLLFSNLWLFKPLLVQAMPSISGQAGAMLRTTIAFTMQEGSHGYNVIPNEASVWANLRFIPHQDAEESLDVITKLAASYGLETEVICKSNPSRSLDLNGGPFHMTEDVIHTIFPGVGIMPYVVTGGTDCRFWDQVCDACVRFAPILYGPEQMKGMHGLNENMYAASLPMAVDYYKELIQRQETRT
jgi:carboxypeptidase PM20D1